MIEKQKSSYFIADVITFIKITMNQLIKIKEIINVP